MLSLSLSLSHISQIQVYNIAQDQWNTPFSIPSYFGSTGSMAAVYNAGNIYMCGGINANGNGITINTCAIYDMASKSFSNMPSLPVGVNHAAYTTDGTNIYVIGGRYVSFTILHLVYFFLRNNIYGYAGYYPRGLLF